MKKQKISYLGNKNLKAVGVSLEYTKDQLQEYIKCANSFEYFCKKYVKIIHVDKGLIDFIPFGYQLKMAETFGDNRFVLCKLPRQCGKTTIVAAFILHKILFSENYIVAILANKEKQSKEILSRIKFAYQYLPKWIQQGVVEWNKNNIELENGSKIFSSATSTDAARGQSYSLVYLDEFSFVPRNIQSDFFTSVFPTISSGTETKMIITTTPKGMDYFYKLWVESERGDNSFKRMSIHWSETPGRDENWRESMIKDISLEKFNQEYGCEFLGSTNTLIDPNILQRMVYINPFSIDNSSKVKVYEEVIKDHTYAMTVDISEGIGQDYNSFVVCDITTIPYKVVATYNDNKISELVFPTLLNNVGKYYNDCYILIETNLSTQVAYLLREDLEYDNLIYTKSMNGKGTIIYDGAGSRIGIKTNKAIKRNGCMNLKTLVENDKFLINDIDIVQQFKTFIGEKGTYHAEEGHNDDLVMCMVLFSWLANQDYFKQLTNNDIRKNILEQNNNELENQTTPFIHDIHEEPHHVPLYGHNKIEIIDMSEDDFNSFMIS